MSSRAPLDPQGPFRIHVVAKMTGVPEPTLRAWERRYGVPSPERTVSRYRLYGAREVEQVRRMRALADRGLSAAEAARAVRAEATVAGAPSAAPNPDVFADARARLARALDRFDVEGLEAQTRSLSVLAPPVVLFEEVIAPVLRDVGDRWKAGALSVGHEHMVSHVLGGFMHDLLRLAAAGARTPVLMASFADEEHELGLLGVGLSFAAWGLRPIVLGARTPPSAVRDAVRAASPSLVALSVTIAPPAPRARKLIDEYAAACGRVAWIVGGAGSAGLADRVRARGGLVDPRDPTALRATVTGLRPR